MKSCLKSSLEHFHFTQPSAYGDLLVEDLQEGLTYTLLNFWLCCHLGIPGRFPRLVKTRDKQICIHVDPSIVNRDQGGTLFSIFLLLTFERSSHGILWRVRPVARNYSLWPLSAIRGIDG